MAKVTARTIEKLKPPKAGNTIIYDEEVPGFGVRITAAGVLSFVLNYRVHGRERRYTIGRHPELTPSAARERAIQWRSRIADGDDPLEKKRSETLAPTIRELTAEYLRDYAEVHKRAKSLVDDKANIGGLVIPRLGHLRVIAVTTKDIEDLHVAMKATPYRANRVLALLRTVFSFAVRRGMRADNPAVGVTRFKEQPRNRWLTEDEVVRLNGVLDAQPNQEAANAIRLMLLTGSRKSEVLTAKWLDVDLEAGLWRKPSAHTKQKREELVPLNPPAVEVLKTMRTAAKTDYIFPNREGRGGSAVGVGPRRDVRLCWNSVRTAAKLNGVRLHDLRHTFASHLVSGGMSLPIVGRLLGHTQPATTNRYAHLAQQPLKDATAMVGEILRKK